MTARVILGEYPPFASATDRLLFDRLRAEYPKIDSVDFFSFCERYSQLDIRTQTALLCDMLRSQPRQQSFVQAVEAGTFLSQLDARPTLLIVPGAFYRQHTHTGADGQRLIQIAEELGWPCERLATASFGNLEENADVLLDRLKRMQAESIVLASLSKGSAEVATALARPEAAVAFERVTGWVSLSGMVYGTPLVDWLRARPLRVVGVRILLWLRGQSFAVLEQLRRTEPTPDTISPFWPAHLRAIQVLGFPLQEHLSHTWAKRAYERLAALGPNDGGGNLLIDALRWPGQVYPLWGADHYINPPWDARLILLNVLRYANGSTRS